VCKSTVERRIIEFTVNSVVELKVVKLLNRSCHLSMKKGRRDVTLRQKDIKVLSYMFRGCHAQPDKLEKSCFPKHFSC